MSTFDLRARALNPPADAPIEIAGDRSVPIRFLRALAVVLCLAASAPAAHAQTPPPNDHLADAEPILAAEAEVTGDLTDSTHEPDEELAPCGVDQFQPGSVWYRLEPPEQGRVLVTPAAGGFVPVVSAWSGDLHPLLGIACSAGEAIVVEAGPGVPVFLRVSRYPSPPGDNSFDLTLTLAQPVPEHDNRASAKRITELPYQDEAPTYDISDEPDELPRSCEGEWPGLWYAYQPEQDIMVAATVAAARSLGQVSLWRDGPDGLIEVGCATGGPLVVHLTFGSSYFFRASLRGEGNLAFTVEQAPDGPANDTVHGAIQIDELPFEGAVTARWATESPGEPRSECATAILDRGVWYRLSPSASTDIAVQATMFDNIIISSLWEEEGGELTPIGCADGRPLVKELEAGGSYLLKLSAGNIPYDIIRVTVDQTPRLPNDDLADAIVLDPTGDRVAVPVGVATWEPGETTDLSECDSQITLDGSVWYRFTSDDAERILITLAGDHRVVSIWTAGVSGSAHPLEFVSCGSATPIGDVVVLDAEPDRAYFIQVAVAWPQSSAGSLKLELAPDPPVNDRETSPVEIGELPAFYDIDMRGARADGAQPRSECLIIVPIEQRSYSAWFALNPQESGPVGFDSGGLDSDVLLSLWVRNGNSLTEVTCDFGLLGTNVDAGEEYLVRAQLITDVPVGLRLWVFSVNPPANDTLSAATTITEIPFHDTVFTDGARHDDTAPMSECGSDQDLGVWYRFTPLESGLLQADTYTSAPELDTVLSWWSVDDTGELTELGCSDDARELHAGMLVSLEAGEEYVFHAAGLFGDVGRLGFSLRVPDPPPANDDLADAHLVTGSDFSHTVDTAAATSEPDEATSMCEPGADEWPEELPADYGSVWYKYVASASGTVTFSTAGSEYDTVLSLWNGERHPLAEIDCSDDGGQALWSEVTTLVDSGQELLIRVSGPFDFRGELVLTAIGVPGAGGAEAIRLFAPMTLTSR
jgi:hypothetical protein